MRNPKNNESTYTVNNGIEIKDSCTNCKIDQVIQIAHGGKRILTFYMNVVHTIYSKGNFPNLCFHSFCRWIKQQRLEPTTICMTRIDNSRATSLTLL